MPVLNLRRIYGPLEKKNHPGLVEHSENSANRLKRVEAQTIVFKLFSRNEGKVMHETMNKWIVHIKKCADLLL